MGGVRGGRCDMEGVVCEGWEVWCVKGGRL